MVRWQGHAYLLRGSYHFTKSINLPLVLVHFMISIFPGAGKPAGVLVRVAPSFLRFGSVQLAAKRQGVEGLIEIGRYALEVIAAMEARDDDSAKYFHGAAVADLDEPTKAQCFFTARSSPSCAANVDSDDDQEVLRCLLERVVERSAALVAAWTATGFAHGVMNTDNMSLLGISLDLNVYGWMERTDDAFVPNHVDDEARYAFGKQAEMMRWNLRQLAQALGGVRYLQDHEADVGTWADGSSGWLPEAVRKAELTRFDGVYERCLGVRRRLRLGLPLPRTADTDSEAVETVVKGWTRWLKRSKVDFHRAHRCLADIDIAPLFEAAGDDHDNAEKRQHGHGTAALAALAVAHQAGGIAPSAMRAAVVELQAWLIDYSAVLRRGFESVGACADDGKEKESMVEWRRQMRAVNPVTVLRTAPVRRLTLFAAEQPAESGGVTSGGGESGALQAVWRMVAEPFNATATLAEIDAEAEAGVAEGGSEGGGSVLRREVAVVALGLHKGAEGGTEEIGHSSRQLLQQQQTSCGGQ